MKEKEMMGLTTTMKAHKDKVAEWTMLSVIIVASLLQIVQNRICFVFFGFFNIYMVAILSKRKQWGLVGAYVFLTGTAIWGFIAWGN